MMFYLAFAAFFVSARFGLACFGAWFAAIAGAAIWGPETLNSIGVPQIAPFILGFMLNLHVGEFMLGMVAAWIIQSDVRVRAPRILLAVVLVAAAAFAAYEANYLPEEQTLRSVTVAYGVLAAMIVFAVVQAELRYPVRIPRWLTLLGAASYAIYLTHYLVVALAVVLAAQWPALAAVPASLLLLVLLPLGLAPGIVLHLARGAAAAPHVRGAPAEAGIALGGRPAGGAQRRSGVRAPATPRPRASRAARRQSHPVRTSCAPHPPCVRACDRAPSRAMRRAPRTARAAAAPDWTPAMRARRR